MCHQHRLIISASPSVRRLWVSRYTTGGEKSLASFLRRYGFSPADCPLDLDPWWWEFDGERYIWFQKLCSTSFNSSSPCWTQVLNIWFSHKQTSVRSLEPSHYNKLAIKKTCRFIYFVKCTWCRTDTFRTSPQKAGNPTLVWSEIVAACANANTYLRSVRQVS